METLAGSGCDLSGPRDNNNQHMATGCGLGVKRAKRPVEDLIHFLAKNAEKIYTSC